jgi:glycerol uptake facilitator-like aquaporin
MTLARRLTAEFLGTAFLLVAIVGSGIMGERLAGGNEAIALLANSLATGGALVALILTFGPLSGAHFNPLVSAALAAHGELPWREVVPYACAQLFGALSGVMAAHAMFSLALVQWSSKARSGYALMWSESIATFGLLAVVLICVRHRSTSVPYAVAAYIAGAYWFTSSTSFANPVVTLARSLTDTFAGIQRGDVGGFLVAQMVAALITVPFISWILTERVAVK